MITSFNKKRFIFTKVIAAGLSALTMISTMTNNFVSVNAIQNIRKNKSKNTKSQIYLRKIIDFSKKDPIKFIALVTSTIFGLKYIYDLYKFLLKPKVSSKTKQLNISGNQKIFEVLKMKIPELSQGTSQEELKTIFKLAIINLKEFVRKDKQINDNFANIPFKRRLSESDEAKSLILQLQDIIDGNGIGNIDHIKKVIELLNRIAERKQLWRQNYIHSNLPEYFFTENSTRIYIEDLTRELELKDVLLISMISFCPVPSFKAEDLGREKKFFVKIFTSLEKAQDELKIYNTNYTNMDKSFSFESNTAKKIIEIDVKKNKSEKAKLYIVVSELSIGQNFCKILENFRKKYQKIEIENLILDFLISVSDQLQGLHKTLYRIHGNLEIDSFLVCVKDKILVGTKMMDLPHSEKTLGRNYNFELPIVKEFFPPEYCNERLRCLTSGCLCNIIAKYSLDIWNFGCMACYILNNKYPFKLLSNTKNEEEKLKHLIKQQKKFFENEEKRTKKYKDTYGEWKNAPDSINKIIRRCLVSDPRARPSAKQINSWLINIKKENCDKKPEPTA
ncbi:MAG: hypothetical protein LBJ32_00490 [Oscillospiraceae bacterium]|jgi:serine/threonine protein kinase|nr:hypothetical protein [Oscillospiraceae bacterium]